MEECCVCARARCMTWPCVVGVEWAARRRVHKISALSFHKRFRTVAGLAYIHSVLTLCGAGCRVMTWMRTALAAALVFAAVQHASAFAPTFNLGTFWTRIFCSSRAFRCQGPWQYENSDWQSA